MYLKLNEYELAKADLQNPSKSTKTKDMLILAKELLKKKWDYIMKQSKPSQLA